MKDLLGPRASRRALLRGAGVALALPWLESLAPRTVRAEATPGPKRFLPIYLPNGSHEFWRPQATGNGDAWQLSSILEPFGASLKPKLSVLTGLENGSVFNADRSPYVESSHGRLGGAWLTCVDAAAIQAATGLVEANGISVDQVLAQSDAFRNQPLASLQVGLSTPLSNCDSQPCSSSRSVSWASRTEPMYKLVNPLDVFNRIAGVAATPQESQTAAAEAAKRRLRNQSVLDAVLENAKRTRDRLGQSDRMRMDEFLEAVRAVEQRATSVSNGMPGARCTLPAPGAWPEVQQDATAPRQTTHDYDKGAHADAMNELIALAFECDVTRVVSYMLEDERSEFVYDNVELRAFSETGSEPKGGACPEYHIAQHGGDDPFATITWWNVGKVADLCRKLDAIEEAPGVSVLDNTLVFFAGCMQGGSHRGNELPVALIGGRNLGFAGDRHLLLEGRPLRDLYFTLLNEVYGLGVGDFGQSAAGDPIRLIDALV